MVKRMVRATISAIIFAGLAGCAAERPERYIELDGNETVGLWVGQTVRVEMEANPTTGYMWRTQGDPEGVVRQKGKYRYVRRSDAIGAGGKQVYRYLAVKQGKTSIVFEYIRPWEPDAEPAKRYVLGIIAH
ncbi:MAG: hypothetical protein GF408_03760 [Candidatus Omnitrophica bacterium]|nr:hypothetical protein [Candidatus Omnitrophota bacterium]